MMPSEYMGLSCLPIYIVCILYMCIYIIGSNICIYDYSMVYWAYSPRHQSIMVYLVIPTAYGSMYMYKCIYTHWSPNGVRRP